MVYLPTFVNIPYMDAMGKWLWILHPKYLSPKSGWSFRDTFIYSNPKKFGVLPQHLEKPVDRIAKIHRIQIPFIKKLNQVLSSDLLGCVKWPFQGLSDLHLGDQRVTLNHQEQVVLLHDSSFETHFDVLCDCRKEHCRGPQQCNCPPIFRSLTHLVTAWFW